MKYAIISDIHEDINSLRDVIELTEKFKVDKLVCLGDITGFSHLHHTHSQTKDADACVDLVKKNFDIVVAGNHDYNSINRMPKHLIRHAKAQSSIPKKTWNYQGEVHADLSTDSTEFLNNLPEYYIETAHNFRILFSHFTYPDLTGSTMIVPETKKELKSHFNFMKRKNCLLGFLGHTHINGYASSSGNYVRFKEFGFTKIAKKQQIIFGPAIVKDGNRSGFMIFDSIKFELSIIRVDV